MNNGETIHTRAFLAFTDADQWRPGIGDPTVMGWVTVVVYFVAALLCLRAALQVEERNLERAFWLILFLALAVLGVNKQLDLQTWLTLAGRRMAIAMGWYEQRQYLQIAFMALVLLGGVFTFHKAWRTLSDSLRTHWVALAGIFILVCFVVMRAFSFHHIDALLKSDLGGVRMNWLFELAGIVMIGGAAARKASRRRPNAPASHSRLASSASP